MMIPSVGDLIHCANYPNECPPGIGWGVRLAVAAVVALAVTLHAVARRGRRGRRDRGR